MFTAVLSLAFTGLPIGVFLQVAGTKLVRAIATVATMKVEFKSFRVEMCSEEGQGGALAISVKERVGKLLSWGAGTHVDVQRLLAKLVSRKMLKQ